MSGNDAGPREYGGVHIQTIKWMNGFVQTIDQSKLPNEETSVKLESCAEVAEAIRSMKIRGAPLIGVAAAFALALTAYHSKAEAKEDLLEELASSADFLRGTRPTAVNLFWACDRILEAANKASGDLQTVVEKVVDEALCMAQEDVSANRKIGEFGSTLIDGGDTILTHCNAGSLATVGYGTALGVIRAAWEDGKKVKVIATETRPKLQGARLTSYELQKEGIPVTLITDNMVGYCMYRRLVDKVVVGADRIVGDAVVNKIGTYTVAALAHEHGIPFYVAAPKSTFDLNSSSQDVKIELRDPNEVTCFNSKRIAPLGVKVFNPAFDITPMKYITAVICETGVLTPSKLGKLNS